MNRHDADYYADEVTRLRSDLAVALRAAAHHGVAEGVCNHFSVELPDRSGRFLVNPRGLMWQEIGPEDIVLVDAEGRRMELLNPAAVRCIQGGMLTLIVQPESAPATPAFPVEDDDHALVRAAGGGDMRAFETLYRRHARRVFGVVWRICGGQEARAEDLTQEAFVRAWQALPKFRFESAFSPGCTGWRPTRR